VETRELEHELQAAEDRFRAITEATSDAIAVADGRGRITFANRDTTSIFGWRPDELLGQPFTGRTALLSPLDRLVYDRRRLAEIFEFDYQLEMFKPVAKRRWGYWAMPILHGDRLVGKLDATADRKAGVLRVDAVHEDVPFTKAMTRAVHDEIKDLAAWLRLPLVMAP